MSRLYYTCPTSRRFFRRFAALLTTIAFAAFQSVVVAQTGSGAITGTVINAETNKALERAEVEIAGTQHAALTNAAGVFRLGNIPSGKYTVTVSYAGLEPMQKEVEVQPNATASLSFDLTSNIITLGEFKVSGAREGNAFAVQQQKTSESLRMVVSSDAFGAQGDANPGEFLKSLPGMTMEYTGIEPRRVSVRGLEPNLVQVLLNGNQVANAASASLDRAFEFDHTSIDAVESMDVSLAARPDIPANTIGGTINIITRNALMQKGRRLDLTLTLTGNDQSIDLKKTSGPNDERSYKILPGFSAVFSDTFMDGRLGVAFTAGLTQFHGMGYTAYDTYTLNSVPTTASGAIYHESNTSGYINRYRREQHQNYQRRLGSSLSLDYKLSSDSTLFFRALYTDYFYEFRNRFLQYNVSNPVAGYNPEYVQAGSGSNIEQEMSFGNKLGRSITFNAGANHRLGDWTINYDAWLSRATSHYEYPDFFGGARIRMPATFVLSKLPGTALASVSQLSADPYTSLNTYAPNGTVSSNFRIGSDEFLGAKGSVRRAFDFALPTWIEGGVSMQRQERTAGNHRRDWNWGGVTNLSQFAEDYDPEIGWGERAPDRWISPFKLNEYARNNPALFVETAATVDNALLNDRRGTETIAGTYLNANVKWRKLEVTAGFRFERTEMDAEGGVRQNPAVGTSPIVRLKSDRSYSPWPFKDVHCRYQATKKLQARASYTEAFGRPNLSDLVPTTTFNSSSQTWSVSNTKLKPQRSQNYDAAVEYYIKGTNYVSVGWFRKEIKEYINTNTAILDGARPEFNIPDPGIATQYITTRFNLPKAIINGAEISGRYELPFIPSSIGKFELWGNYTHLYDIEAQAASFVAASALRTVDYLPNVPPWFWNAGIAYQTQGGKLRANLKCNFSADKYKNFNQTYEQVNDRLTTDADISYRFNKTYVLTFSMRNVFSVDEGETLAERTVRTGNGGGRSMTLSVKGSF